ncbi:MULTISPECIES: ATP-binding cassette domain-containing protein [unclassified Desulfovibrio]|uniref:ATP-binding cassette domain-containing protein n=1 Tax=unclassified Desulfovibrio TaxID=2593640 RepID=UPI000F5DAA6D|nr:MULTISPECIES: ATP-binding cassette domain-containing protein [unclassified Desulfovibrio]RRD70937.1 ATP-binding cassette domain-containing protein [Desulfovibrio sp. OH1209_COT-279]RRD87310.1 ATP-binding cassette domain-containing protein [Desulfovibrio sp. OH1186_COT-070]
MSILVSVCDVSLFLPGDPRRKNVLRRIDWRIEQGQHCALLGPNGSGKSTLLRLLAGELWPEKGKIFWHGPQGAEDSPLAGRAMTSLISPAQQENCQRQAWDFAGRDLLLTGFEASSLLYSPVQDARRRQAVEHMAARLHATGLLDRSIDTLSQGQLRLLLLGRALLRASPLLLLDECLEGLDAAHRKIFSAVLDECAQSCTVIMAVHRPEQIPSWCTHRRFVHDGQLLEAPPRAARNNTAPPEKKSPSALHSPFAAASTASRTKGPLTGEPLLEMENASVYVGRKKILHEITWSMYPNENWQITGANGSGKSTLLRLLAGDEFVAEGGRLTRRLPGHEGPVDTLAAVRRGIRLVSDLSQALYGYSLNALDMVCTGSDNSIGVYRRFSPAERAEALRHMHFLFPEKSPQEVEELGGRPVRHLSTGQIRRLFLARALMGQPDILLLDEPCSGLDEFARTAYLSLLDQLAAQGMHMVFVSHHQEDAPLCINRQAHMEGGRLLLPPAH